ncbi:hypothetical protein OMW55_11795 [Sphingomonas sp. BN140010]|uniref:DUF6894 domain-containing protein n=1 Tax=Sphingomonas arvum TaxID=2992113 RepID=A0ABT3JHC8_9SPHN|nr:hypothetical protein [Sphingomonas sp. BN140010]MCW3798488.1 hypothetical protein [Sphingomonas sp. BN140010]
MPRSSVMPRFYLHLENRVGLTRDHDGQEFPDLAAARTAAAANIRDILAEEVKHGRLDMRGLIRIADAQDPQLSVVPFAEALAVTLEGESG